MSYHKIIFLAVIVISGVGFVPQQKPKEIFLWPHGVPGSEEKNSEEKFRMVPSGERVVYNVHNPSIIAFIPLSVNSTGVAVIIAPGGGHRELWIEHEGYNPALWFQERGIAAFVLKYRLAKDTNSTYAVKTHALADMKRAIQLVRSKAKEWNIDTSKVGVMGFSAGGELAALAAMEFINQETGYDIIDLQSAYPNFQALLYPGATSSFEATKSSPPVFLAGGYKDRPDISEGLATVYLKYRKVGVPAELHIFSNVGHGFGLRTTTQGAIAYWPERFMEWLTALNFLKRKVVE